jgi:hypothetical protein
VMHAPRQTGSQKQCTKRHKKAPKNHFYVLKSG